MRYLDQIYGGLVMQLPRLLHTLLTRGIHLLDVQGAIY